MKLHFILFIILSFLKEQNSSKFEKFEEKFWQDKENGTNMSFLFMSCLSRDELEKCNSDAFDNWGYFEKMYEMYAKFFHENQELKRFCCAVWNTIDCQIKLASNKCQSIGRETNDTWQTLFNIWNKDNQCSKNGYGYGSTNCNSNDWKIALIVVVSVKIIIILAYILYRIHKKKNVQTITYKFKEMNEVISLKIYHS